MSKSSLVLFGILALYWVAGQACFPTPECRTDADCQRPGLRVCIATVCQPCQTNETCTTETTPPDATPSEPRPEPTIAPETKPESTAETKPEPAPEPKTEPQSEPRPEPIPEAQPEPKPEPTGCKTDADCQPDEECQPGSGQCKRATCYPTKLVFRRGTGIFPSPVFLSATELAFCSDNGIEIWNHTTQTGGNKQRTLDQATLITAITGTSYEKKSYVSLAFHATSNTLYAGHPSGLIGVWKRQNGTWSKHSLLYSPGTRDKHGIKDISAIAIQPQTNGKLAIGTTDGKVFLLDPNNPNNAPTIVGGPGSPQYAFRTTANDDVLVEYLRFSPNGTFLWGQPPSYVQTTGTTPGARIWNINATTTPTCDFSGRTTFLGDMNNTLKQVIHAPNNQSMQMHTLQTTGGCSQKLIKEYPANNNRITWRGGAYHPDNHTFAAIHQASDRWKFFFLNTTNLSLLQQDNHPFDKDFVGSKANKYFLVAYNPWNPKYLVTAFQIPETVMVWTCK
jgi:hypothetical protein